MCSNKYVWVFHGEGARFCCAIFTSKELAHRWIESNKLKGVLTKYPLDESVYDWSVKNGFFKPSKDHELSADFKEKFTTASQEHYHYEKGEKN